jgi:hypothetical protein
MWRIGFSALFLLSVAVSGVSAQEKASANFRMPGCRDAVASKDTKSPFLEGVCTGAVDALLFAAVDICPPSEGTLGQALRVVVKYIDDRPARLHEDFRMLAVEAMRAAWPCKKKK